MALKRWLGPGGRLFAIFAGLSLIPVLSLGTLLAVQNRHDAEAHGIAQARSQAEVIARVLSETQLEGRSLKTGLTDEEQRRITAFVTSEVKAGHITRLRLRAPDTTVVYTSDGSIPTGVDDDAREALEGEIIAEITHLNRDDGTGTTGARSVEVYTVMHNPRTNAPTGVLEIYLPYEAIASDLAAGLHRLYLVLGLGLGLLYLVLAGVAGWTTRRLSLQSSRYQHLATHDPLTDLPNRTLFGEWIAQSVASLDRDGGSAVVFIDLDRFREINDTLGHHNGDQLLIQIAERLRISVRDVDSVARLGGDEFGLILPGVANADQLREPLVPVLAALEQELNLGGLLLSPQASLGVVFIPADGEDPNLLIQRADIAMYEAKRTHSSVACYDPTQDHYNGERLALASELRRAIQRDELVLHYQPQVHQPTGQVDTLEALVRWQHPTRGLLSPDTFVPMAEQTGLIDDLTDWVLDAALPQLAEWRVERPELVVAVNISARSLHDQHFPRLVTEALERAGALPDWLILEITETALVTDAVFAAKILGELSLAGLRLSLDDFGQGYTSLGQLSRLPVSELKIDKSFVLNMMNSSRDAVIVRSVIDLAHNLGLKVVAEGVEHEEALDALNELGCDIAQGYWFCRPLPAEQVPAWLSAHARAAILTGTTRR